MGSYKVLRRSGIGEIEEKRSRFIGEIRAVENEAAARAMIDEIRRKHYDARHHCYAFICPDTAACEAPDGAPIRMIQRSSDDGEPSGTAGRPILSVLLGSGLTGVCLVVTRYFGGTLLGTGGLIRAYTAAAQEALAHAVIEDVIETRREKLVIPYSELDRTRYRLEKEGAVIVEITYTDMVTLVADRPVQD